MQIPSFICICGTLVIEFCEFNDKKKIKRITQTECKNSSSYNLDKRVI